MDIHSILLYLQPNAKFTLNANDYNQLVWLSSDIDKPTLLEIKEAVAGSKDFYTRRKTQRNGLSKDLENIIGYILSDDPNKELAKSTLDKYNARKEL